MILKKEFSSLLTEDSPEPKTGIWKSKDGKTRDTIRMLIKNAQVVHMRLCKTAKETWNNPKIK